MNTKTIRVMLVMAAAVGADLRAADLRVADLRCEYLTDPLGIDVAVPRLSWKLQADRRGQCQTGYQILVASSRQTLDADRGDLWDSGKVAGDQTLHIDYAGRTLVSGQACFWKVRCWDRDGQLSEWSQPARWSMGLLRPDDWHGHWIGRDEPAVEAPNPLTGAAWIWHDKPATGKDYPPGSRGFRRSFVLPAERTIAKAACYFAADNRHELWVNGRKAAGGGSFKSAQGCDVTSWLRPGPNTVAVRAENVGEAANPAGLLGAIEVQFEQGEPLRIVTDAAWLSSASVDEGWQEPAFEDGAWTAAVVLAPLGAAPWGDVAAGDDDRPLPARLLRRDFTAEKQVKRAMAYVTGLGYYELYLNGRKVGDHVLDSVLMDYDFRVPYVTYEVTESIRRGENAIGVMLGNGRYFAPRLRVPVATKDYGYPKLLLEMVLEFEDGTTRRIVSDASWRLTTEGPIRENNDYDGEVYDARRELPGWSQPGFDDSAWQPAQRVAAPEGRLVAPRMPPMRVIETLVPVTISEPRPGVWIFDLGQNIVGWCRLHVAGPAGTTVRLRHAETLDADGLLYTENLRSARCRDVYVLRGGEPETYEPRFAYHGFRFVELTGYPGRPDLSTIQGRVVHTDLPPAGRFSSSNALLNQLHQSIRWGLRGNYLSIPTDCPQRDERQGWQGDRAAESRGETYFFENVTLYNKWLVDIQLSQNQEGNLSDVCPPYWPFYSGNVTWPSAYSIIPGTLYDQFGDRRNLEIHYASIQRWMDYLGQFIQDGIIDRDTYGDWCVPPETPELIHSQDPLRKTGKAVLATCYFHHNLQLLSRYAMILGRPQEEARSLLDRAAEMNRAFHARFYDSQAARYDNGTQTSSVLPLAFGMAPEEDRQRVFAGLVENIEQKTGGHIGTGLIGGQWLMRTLSDHGRADLAYRLATNRTYPSWGYMIDHGATTVWELWNGNTADPAMNSGNHVMLVGDLGIWLYEYLAGIKSCCLQPAFKHLVMRPFPVGDLQHVDAEYRSIRGTVRSHWRIAGDAFVWEVTVPTGSKATLYLPAPPEATITESGQALHQAEGVKQLDPQDGRAVIAVDSGTYRFEAKPWRRAD